MTVRASTFVVAALLISAPPLDAGAGCLVTTIDVAIGSFSPGGVAPRDSVGNIAVNCSGPPGAIVRYRIAMTAGSSGTFSLRQMKPGSGGALAYNLFADAARLVVWGDGSAGTVTVADAYALGAPVVTRNYPVYARVYGGQSAPVGTFVDTLVVTLDY